MLKVQNGLTAEQKQLLSESAQGWVQELMAAFADKVPGLLEARSLRQQAFDQGQLPDFLPETQAVRDGDWQIRGIPADLTDRRVEITGPTERKMVINALNAGTKVFMADFEDSLSPTWQAVMQGQVNLRDAVDRTITYTDPKSGKYYSLTDEPAVLICRVRGLHLPEKHVTFNGRVVPGCLWDFALYFFHNHKRLLENGSGPYFYLPKLQSHLEARFWSQVFCFTEDRFGLPRGTIKATVLIETLPAVFEMDEILFELKDHIVALNCGRWDYIFSYIKTLGNHPDRVLPDRQVVTMDQPFLNAYSRLLIRTCHKRGALAMGGMAAFIPAKEAERNQWVLNKVRQDKELEARNGHDGTWIAHPGLADTALSVFDEALGDSPNQLAVTREGDAPITAAELLAPCEGERTEAGMRTNIRVALQYIEAWIDGNGCVPIYGLMEDAATAEICRASIWQWLRHGKTLAGGQKVTAELFTRFLTEEMAQVREELGADRFDNGRFREAAELLTRITVSDRFVPFLTEPGYTLID
ncbi:malate synthase A [Gallaecimonas xiamenensis]|uniref:malate synthase n=1 Tax=Gallaecimonas xiamenensis 3-C-1 TaxID=745411 RepID=K2JI67_9GAMM|nr:malate synthase A [Gallaecimonas xiamenensis]EKE74918.1 malate synthase [Gallaecimonas xiamenensis 3-C-1]